MLICLDQRTGTGCGAENRDGAQFCQRCGKPLRFALQLHNTGVVVGNYRVLRVIGHGGFGAVYEAEDLRQAGRRVALKETFDPDQIESFRAEFAVLSRLQHPHLPRYFEVFEANANGYLVMELVPGQSLQNVLDKQQGPLLESQVLGYALQLCDALAYLHSQQPAIIHRDIKPANVRLTPEGLIKLVDFGLVKEGAGATRSSRRAVTPAYAPLEQWGMGGQHTDARSDLYSLGATLYHLLTGQAPPPATDRVATSIDPLAPPRQLNPRLSPPVADAVRLALCVRLEQRPAGAAELRSALLGGALAISPGAGSPPPAPIAATKFQRGVLRLIEYAKNDFRDIMGRHKFTDDTTHRRLFETLFTLEDSKSGNIQIAPDGTVIFHCYLVDESIPRYLDLDDHFTPEGTWILFKEKKEEVRQILTPAWVVEVDTGFFQARHTGESLMIHINPHIVSNEFGSVSFQMPKYRS